MIIYTPLSRHLLIPIDYNIFGCDRWMVKNCDAKKSGNSKNIIKAMGSNTCTTIARVCVINTNIMRVRIHISIQLILIQ